MVRKRCGLPSTSLSAPSCKAEVYARCRLKTMGMGVERPLPELWVVRGPILAIGSFAFIINHRRRRLPFLFHSRFFSLS